MPKTHAAVIHTNHALTKSTRSEFEHCEVKDGHVRIIGKHLPSSKYFFGAYREDVMISTIVAALACAGKIFDMGYWLITWERVGLKVRMKAILLNTEE